jgi:hypothetical protein
LNHLKHWVEALQLDAGVGGCKPPVCFAVMGIATDDPGLDLALKGPLVGDAPAITLGRLSACSSSIQSTAGKASARHSCKSASDVPSAIKQTSSRFTQVQS